MAIICCSTESDDSDSSIKQADSLHAQFAFNRNINLSLSNKEASKLKSLQVEGATYAPSINKRSSAIFDQLMKRRYGDEY